MAIYKATLKDISTLVPLFDAYAIFYNQASDQQECEKFLTHIMTNDEAIIFIARSEQNKPLGFTLLYPSYSSVSRARIFVLNDLFVIPESRKSGVGAALLDHAVSFGRAQKAVRLHLETEKSNESAQSLYEKNGWLKEEKVYHYNYTF